MRILLFGPGPWCATGYGIATRHAARMFRRLGHQVTYLATLNAGGRMTYDGYEVLPARPELWTPEIAQQWIAEKRADLLLVIFDAWVFNPTSLPPRTALLFPVDTEPASPMILDVARRVFYPIAFSQFGQHACREAGVEVDYVPLVVDTATFRPGSRAIARQALNVPDDLWLATIVGLNAEQLSRKCLPQQLEAFARFHRRHTDTALWLHSNPHGLDHGLNLWPLIERLGLTDCIYGPSLVDYLSTASDGTMAQIYQASNVLLQVSMSEGFGLPLVEAAACGVPAITGEWTSMAELCWYGSILPRSDTEPFWTVFGAYRYLPHIAAIEAKLEDAYAGRYDLGNPETARAGALGYSPPVVQEMWRGALGRIATRLSSHDA